ncbi:uncharacterized protein LOC110740284 [Chenopodium quinoa]|nr:uncharacterized protein LOC110740284 [Chenopodium quinoa]
MSTRIIHNPKGDRANVLREWAYLYMTMLMDKQARVLQVKYPSNNKLLLTIAEVGLKKACNAVQDERFWLRVTIPYPSLDKLHTYVGCNTCSAPCDIPGGAHYQCSICKKIDRTASYRVYFEFEAADGTGTMSFTALNDDTEKLFGMTASEINSCKTTGNLAVADHIQFLVETKSVLIKIGPTTELSRYNVLNWQVKGLEVERTTPDSIVKATLKKLDEELNDLLDRSEEIKYSDNNELTVFYSEDAAFASVASVAQPTLFSRYFGVHMSFPEHETKGEHSGASTNIALEEEDNKMGVATPHK